MNEVQKDIRYNYAKTLIENGQITNLEELFKQVPKLTIALGLGINATTFSNFKSKQPGNFKLREIITLSSLLDIEICKVVELLVNSINNTD